MSETKHTPGPWEVHREPAIDYRANSVFGADGKSLVAWCAGGGPRRAIEGPEEDANAKLIASAPDMLEALQASREADAADDAMREAHERATAEDWINDPTGSLHVRAYVERYNDAVRRANDLRDAAIAKATGEPS
jgi:hypothetical protein